MNESQFNILRTAIEYGERVTLCNDTVVCKELTELGLVHEGVVTEKGMREMEHYRVDNAIIMAAGYSARCMPLSNIMPKGLFRVKGEILIEREIEQLLEAGIEEIVVVTGFMSEKFEYLKDKYGVVLIYNEDYDKYNNMASLYSAQNHMRNSYILCSDNYYEENVFHQYVFSPYYSCVYSEEYCDEFCVREVDEKGYILNIQRGGAKSWYTIGDAYFNKEFSQKFCHYMNNEWADYQVRNMLMDDFHIRHIKELPLKKVERPGRSVLEFDTLEEIKEYDSGFDTFVRDNLDNNNIVIKVFSKYSDIKSYHSVPTEQLSGRLHLNENLFKPSPKCLEVLKNIEMEDLYLYDLTHKDELVAAISKACNISANNIFVHNGSSEVIKSIFSILLNENDNVLIPTPGWSYYKSVSDAKFANCITYEVREDEETYQYSIEDILQKAKKYSPKIIVVTCPHMPTGCVIEKNDIERIISQNENSIIMLDEAYWGYEEDDSTFEKKIITQYSNVVITRTFSKFYGLANIRIGYGLCSYPLRRTIGLDLPLFRASGISRKIAIAAIEDKEYYDSMKVETIKVRDWFMEELNKMERVKVYKTGANFVFVKLIEVDAEKVRAFMEENNILLRLFTDKEALRLRITIAPRDIMERVLYQLRRVLSSTY